MIRTMLALGALLFAYAPALADMTSQPPVHDSMHDSMMSHHMKGHSSMKGHTAMQAPQKMTAHHTMTGHKATSHTAMKAPATP
ncbi:MAG TPA: hypothetical protein VME66_03120 [Candidatus Acidoferrales bacterium]|nr:hypothetical protein [Candidatus Acidoferrales bacterium]